MCRARSEKGGGWWWWWVVGGEWWVVSFCISAFTVPDFRNKSQWMEKREKTEKACLWLDDLLGSMGWFHCGKRKWVAGRGNTRAARFIESWLMTWRSCLSWSHEPAGGPPTKRFLGNSCFFFKTWLVDWFLSEFRSGARVKPYRTMRCDRIEENGLWCSFALL